MPRWPTKPPHGEIPRSEDIDPRTIDAPVLTQHGWVVPDQDAKRARDAARKAARERACATQSPSA